MKGRSLGVICSVAVVAAISLQAVPVAAGGFTSFGESLTITGTQGADTIQGTPRADVIGGLGGNDVINGLGGDDLLCGFGGSDRVRGGSGADLLSGDKGNDTVAGGGGSDILLGFAGNDTFNGGPGFDYASWFFSSTAVQVDLDAGTATGEGTDAVLGVEGVEGSDHDDTLLGDAGDNEIAPSGGNDTVDGRGGVDDTLDFTFAGAGVTVDLGLGTVTGEGSDTVTGVEDVYGSRFADTIVGDDGSNDLFGGRGDDSIQGGDGGDLLFGEKGND